MKRVNTSSKKTLCIDARMLFSSGIGTYIRNILPYLEPFFSITLLVQKEEEKMAKERFQLPTILVDCPIYSLKEQLLLPYKIPVTTLFWSPHYTIPLLPITAKKRIVTIHDVCHLAMPEFFPKGKRLLAFFLLKQAIRRSDLVLTVSSFSLQEMEKHSVITVKDKNKVQVVLSGIEKKERRDVGFKGLGVNSPFILYVGNLKPHKNIERLVEAFLLLPPQYELVLAGRNFLAGALPSHPRIRVLGEVEEDVLSLLYQNAELLIQPSLYEGFGLTPLEAMAFGCPVVSSGLGGLFEACEGAAFYINPLSTSSLAEGMRAVLENKELRKTLIAAGFKRVEQASLEQAGNKVRELFVALASS